MWIQCKAANCTRKDCTITPSPCDRVSVAQGQLRYINRSISKYVFQYNYDATIRHMKGNFYNKRPISHRGMYLNMDTRKHHSRECLTHSRTHAYTHSIQLCFLLLHQAERTNTGDSMLRNQHARATVSQALYYTITHIIYIT